MNRIKYIGAGICLLLALSQMVPVYVIVSELIAGKEGEHVYYYIGKLLGHLFVMALVLFVASKLIKGVISQKGDNEKGV